MFYRWDRWRWWSCHDYVQLWFMLTSLLKSKKTKTNYPQNEVYSYLKKVVIVNSRYWSRKELWGSSSTNIFITVSIDFAKYRVQIHHIMPRQYSTNLRPSLGHYYSSWLYSKFLSVPVSTIDYDNLYWNSCTWQMRANDRKPYSVELTSENSTTCWVKTHKRRYFFAISPYSYFPNFRTLLSDDGLGYE